MTAALAFRRGGSRAPCSDCIAVSPSTAYTAKGKPMQSGISARKHLQAFKSVAPDVAARWLWAAFPARSENELCEMASRVLGRSPDTYRRILRKETRAAFEEIYPILALAAIRRGIDLFEWLGTPHGTEEGVHSAPVVRGAGETGEGAGEAVGHESEALESPSDETPARGNDRDAA